MVNAGLLSKGTTLSYIENGNVKTIAGVRSIPTVGSDPEKVDVTNLGSSKKRYVKGLQDTDNLEFSVIYKGENFKDIHRLVELDKPLEWLVMYPDGMTVRFTGEVMQKIDGVEVNAAVGFSIVIVVSEGPSIEFAKEPSRPTALKASNIQFDQFNLSWSGSGLFRVYVDRQKVGETYNNTFTVKGLKPSTKHIVRVASASGINEVHAVPIEVTTTELPKITKINVPQRLDLYVGETKQLDVSTVPTEAMRAYEHVDKANDSDIAAFVGHKVLGNSSTNQNVTNNLILDSSSIDNKLIKYEWINKLYFDTTESADKNFKLHCLTMIKDKATTVRIQFNLENGDSFDVRKIITSNEYSLTDFELSDSQVDQIYRNKGFIYVLVNSRDATEFYIKHIKLENSDIVSEYSINKSSGYAYTSANVTFNDADKSSTEFDIFVHKRERMTSPTKADTASFIL